MSKPLFTAISALMGTIIGAGILGIPYVIMRSGFLIGILNMVLVAAIMLLIYLYIGEIGLRTKENHQLTGYAEKYLGKKGKKIMFFAFAFGIYSALIAYIIGEGESLSYLFLNTTSYSLYFGIAFWFLLSIITFFGLKALKKGEKLGITIILILIFSIVALFWNKIDISNLTYNNPALFYFPFSVIMFSFLGFDAIPEVERILSKNKHLTKKAIIITIFLVLIIYTIFTLIVIGTKGQATPHIATLALGKIFVLLGMLTMFTAYLGLSNALVDTFYFDYKKSRKSSWLYTILIPLIMFVFLNLFEKDSFIKVIAISGIVSGGLTSILILFMIKKAKLLGKRKPEYSMRYSKILTWIIILILILAMVFELINAI